VVVGCGSEASVSDGKSYENEVALGAMESVGTPNGLGVCLGGFGRGAASEEDVEELVADGDSPPSPLPEVGKTGTSVVKLVGAKPPKFGRLNTPGFTTEFSSAVSTVATLTSPTTSSPATSAAPAQRPRPKQTMRTIGKIWLPVNGVKREWRAKDKLATV